MIFVKCRSCGRRYDYARDDCCPGCGAYNRPPRHERVDADGTVHHLADAEYAARGHAGSGKVCFEEKTCFEDEARPKASRRKRAAQPAEQSRKTGFVIALLLAVVIPCAAVIARNAVSESRIEEPSVWTEPSESFRETVETEPDAAYHETPRFYTAEDGSVFSLMGWRRQGYAIAVELIADFADSDHEFYASLECVDGFGNPVTLSEFESESGETEVLYFLTEDETLTPQTFVLEEWDYETEEGLVSLWEANL